MRSGPGIWRAIDRQEKPSARRRLSGQPHPLGTYYKDGLSGQDGAARSALSVGPGGDHETSASMERQRSRLATWCGVRAGHGIADPRRAGRRPDRRLRHRRVHQRPAEPAELAPVALHDPGRNERLVCQLPDRRQHLPERDLRPTCPGGTERHPRERADPDLAARQQPVAAGRQRPGRAGQQHGDEPGQQRLQHPPHRRPADVPEGQPQLHHVPELWTVGPLQSPQHRSAPLPDQPGRLGKPVDQCHGALSLGHGRVRLSGQRCKPPTGRPIWQTRRRGPSPAPT